LEAAGKNGGQFSTIDKDLLSGYVRQIYEAVLSIEPGVKSNAEEKIILKEEVREQPLQELIPEPPKIQEEPIPEKINLPIEKARQIVSEKIESSEKKETEIPATEQKVKTADSSKKSISEMYANKDVSGKPTLNEKYKSQGHIIADKLKQTPIKDLKAYIGLNKRFVFIKSLFNGNEKQYEEAISTVNSFKSYEEAIDFIESSVLNGRELKGDEPEVVEFFNLVMRRYLH
jgi:hypothetical protein